MILDDRQCCRRCGWPRVGRTLTRDLRWGHVMSMPGDAHRRLGGDLPFAMRAEPQRPKDRRCPDCNQLWHRCEDNRCNWTGYCTPACPDDVCRSMDGCAWPKEAK